MEGRLFGRSFVVVFLLLLVRCLVFPAHGIEGEKDCLLKPFETKWAPRTVTKYPTTWFNNRLLGVSCSACPYFAVLGGAKGTETGGFAARKSEDAQAASERRRVRPLLSFIPTCPPTMSRTRHPPSQGTFAWGGCGGAGVVLVVEGFQRTCLPAALLPPPSDRPRPNKGSRLPRLTHHRPNHHHTHSQA